MVSSGHSNEAATRLVLPSGRYLTNVELAGPSVPRLSAVRCDSFLGSLPLQRLSPSQALGASQRRGLPRRCAGMGTSPVTRDLAPFWQPQARC